MSLRLRGTPVPSLPELWGLLADTAALAAGIAAPADEPALPRPADEAALAALVYDLLGVRIPDVIVAPGHSTPWRAFCDAYFAVAPVSIWYGARGLSGKSYLAATLGWIKSLTMHADVAIIGGSADQSQKVHDYMQAFWRRPTAPTWALRSDPSTRTTTLRWWNTIKALAASQTQARSGHPQLLIVDEADELKWAIFESVRGQPQDSPGIRSHLVVSSTLQYPDGTMARVLREAAERGWPIHRWGYPETLEPHGWLTPATLERKQAQMTREAWRVEVELGEPSPEGRAIDSAAAERVFEGPAIVDEENRAYEWERPRPGMIYATGTDWGKDDATVHLTLRPDGRRWRVVAYERLRTKPMPWMIGRLMTRLRRYRGEACHDATGVGTWQSDHFTEPADNVVMVGKVRNDLFLDCIAAIERDELRAPAVASLVNAVKYVRNVDLFGAGHPPDPFVALAMAYRAAQKVREPYALVEGRRGPTSVPVSPGDRPAAATPAALTALLGRRGDTRP